MARRFFLWCGVLMVLVGVGPVWASCPADDATCLERQGINARETLPQIESQRTYDTLAKSLLGRPHWSDRFKGLVSTHLPKIALVPFKGDDVPVDLRLAESLEERFFQSLVRSAANRYAVISRKELHKVMSEHDEWGNQLAGDGFQSFVEAVRADLLAIGRISYGAGRLSLSYKLVESETGRVVSTASQTFAYKAVESANAQTLASLEAAARLGAKALLKDVDDVGRILVQGLRFQESGAHSEFGQYVMQLLSDALKKQAAQGPRSLSDLSIGAFSVEEERFRGLSAQETTIEGAVSSGGVYILSGTYWLFDDHVEIRLTLTGGARKTVSWRGKILVSHIPKGLVLEPVRIPHVEQAAMGGPMALYLSSNHGDNPLYKVGDTMVLAVRARRDALLYCFYALADGKIMRIFPNRFASNAKIAGGFVQHIPAKGMGFEFEMTPPAGVESVRCFALDQKPNGTLDDLISSDAFTALGVAGERELIKRFRALTDTALGEASLIVTVAEE